MKKIKNLLKELWAIIKKALSSSYVWIALLAILLLYILKDTISSAWKALFDHGFDTYENLPTSESTLNVTEVISKVQKLMTAMSQLGTDEQAIYDVFTDLNVHDVNAIYNKFGKPYYHSFYGGLGNQGTGGIQLDMFGWLQKELSTSEYNRLKLIVPSAF